MRYLWTIVGSLVGGVIASHLFDLAFDHQHVADPLLLNLIGAVPGLLAGVVAVMFEKRHQWQFTSNLIFAIFTTIICAVGFVLYQYNFTDVLATMPVRGYVAFLGLLSVTVGFGSATFSWLTNKLY